MHVENLQVDALGAQLAELADLVDQLPGVPARPLPRSSDTSRPMASARRFSSASSRPQQTTWAAE